MLIENAGPNIGASDIAPIEAELGVVLPDSYRQFLINSNGGAPTPDTIDVPGALGSPTDVQVFFGIGRSVESSDLGWNLALVRERCPSLQALPIACDSGGNLFCLKFERDAAAKVVYCDLDDPDCSTYEVAASFDEFVGKIRAFEQ
ncbi:SMI1/KNR4 family protein [Leptothrix ochracea]|uniref:SMI1/KNR4 family protein n=1 Tax=Leptothrix ochracea TaxID=735331 RepID=UPI0034E25735